MAEVQQQNGQPNGAGDEATQLENAITEFTWTLHYAFVTYSRIDLNAETVNAFRGLVKAWNAFLGRKQGGQDTCALVSPNILTDTEEYLAGLQNISSAGVEWHRTYLAMWNDFLLTRQGPDADCPASGSFGAEMALPFIDDKEVRLADTVVSQKAPGFTSEEVLLSGVYLCADGQIKEAECDSTQLEKAIVEFTCAIEHYHAKCLNQDLDERTVNVIRDVIEIWNMFLLSKRGGQDTCVIESPDIFNDVKELTSLLESMPSVMPDEMERHMPDYLMRWNDFLQARQGESPVSKSGAIVTSISLLCYVVDMVSDTYTATLFGYNGLWWQCALTLFIVYAAVAIKTVFKWLMDGISCSGPLDALRFLGSFLLNWPDLQLCWAQLRLEWQLSRWPASHAHLVPEWHWRRARVAWLKYAEGMCEACPQALLQLVLLLPELRGDVTWTVSVRMGTTAISLCTAGAALINWDKYERFAMFNGLPLRELAVLHMWAVPVTVSRLLCLALLLSLHLYGALACMALHCGLYYIFWSSSTGLPPTRYSTFSVFMFSVQFLVSPFLVSNARKVRPDCGPRPSHAVRHVLHFFTNAGVTALWALSTPLRRTQPALYVGLIIIVFGLFVLGMLGWLLHRRYWLV